MFRSGATPIERACTCPMENSDPRRASSSPRRSGGSRPDGGIGHGSFRRSQGRPHSVHDLLPGLGQAPGVGVQHGQGDESGSGIGSFANLPLGRIRRSHVEQWVKSMVVADLAAGTIKTRFNNVRSVFRAAVRDRLIPNDQSEGVTIPRQRRREAAMRLPTREQVGALLQAADPSFKTYTALAAFAGLRLGEAAAIQVGDIDFLRKKLAVVRQVQRANQGKRRAEASQVRQRADRLPRT